VSMDSDDGSDPRWFLPKLIAGVDDSHPKIRGSGGFKKVLARNAVWSDWWDEAKQTLKVLRLFAIFAVIIVIIALLLHTTGRL